MPEETGSGLQPSVKYFESPAIQRLLRRLKEGTVTEFRPYFDADQHAVEYTDAQLATELNNEQTKLALELLADKGILDREPAESFYACPHCSSKNLLLRPRCNSCGGESIQSSRGLEHLHCGYKDFESAFVTSKGLVCPHCKESMRALGVDYRKVGVLYKCMECGRLDTAIQHHFTCNSCRRTFKQSEANLEVYYLYRLNPDTKERVERYLLNHEAIRDALLDRGYAASFEQSLKGRSGLPVTVDLAAWQDGGAVDRPGRVELIADFAMIESPLSEDAVRLFVSKMTDLQVSKGIIMTLHGSTDEAKKLAAFSGVVVKDCSGIPNVPEQFEAALDTVISHDAQGQGQPEGQLRPQQPEEREVESHGGEEAEAGQDTLLAMLYGKQEQTLKLIKQISQRTRNDFKRLEELLKKLPEAESEQGK